MLGQPAEWMEEYVMMGNDMEFVDNNTGIPLEQTIDLVAREEQRVGLRKKNTWVMCGTRTARGEPDWAKPPLGVRWVDFVKPGKRIPV